MRGAPLSDRELRELLRGKPASLLYARRGRQNKLLGIDPDTLSDEEMLSLMAREPALIKRPTLVIDGEVVPQPTRTELEEIGRIHGNVDSNK
jgi:arsenate reductase-like glutaredoxin family protein